MNFVLTSNSVGDICTYSYKPYLQSANVTTLASMVLRKNKKHL